MVKAFLVVLVVLGILLLAEYLSRYKGLHSELSRKFVHIVGGIFIATWPFYLGWGQIQLLSLLALVAAIISIKLNVFRSIHAVKRNAVGEVMAAIIVGILALICDDPWIFAAAMLHLSLADGLAAIVGLAYGDNNSYKVLGETRSVAGNLACFFASIAIMLLYTIAGDNGYSALTLLGLPIMVTVGENFAIKGTDNLVIPLLVAFTLTSV
ncbi:MAG TPA: hypothetical protein VFB59_03970 [Candidatus Saccharimonadales bacterium]|nr:hypothetical protein [Candidatus Saccharimonadales bacterium]